MALLHFLRCRTCSMWDPGRDTVSAMEYNHWFPGGALPATHTQHFQQVYPQGIVSSLQTPVGLYLGFPPALWQSMKISTAWLAASPTLYIFFSPCSSTPICQNPHGGPDKDYFFEWGELLAMRLLQLPPISFLDPLCIFLM